MNELNLDLGDGMKLIVEVPQDMGIVQFRAIADKIVKIARIVEKQKVVVKAIRSGNGNIKLSGKKLLAQLSKKKPIHLNELAEKLDYDREKISNRLYYYKSRNKVRNVGNNKWVRL